MHLLLWDDCLQFLHDFENDGENDFFDEYDDLTAAQVQAQSITTEDGVAVVRMKEGEPLAREALESVVAKGVQVGRNSLRVELDGSWRERLRRTLEQVASVALPDA